MFAPFDGFVTGSILTETDTGNKHYGFVVYQSPDGSLDHATIYLKVFGTASRIDFAKVSKGSPIGSTGDNIVRPFGGFKMGLAYVSVPPGAEATYYNLLRND